jgi:voltage-gated potassium channel Kch
MEDEFACIRITRFIHKNFPKITIITKSESLSNSERFKKLGASLVVSRNLETGFQLGRAALSTLGVDNKETDAALDSFRDVNSEFVKSIVFQDKDLHSKME